MSLTNGSWHGQAAVHPPCAEPDYTPTQSLNPLFLILYRHINKQKYGQQESLTITDGSVQGQLVKL